MKAFVCYTKNNHKQGFFLHLPFKSKAMTQEQYDKEIEFIFNQFPSYQKVGKIAYKPGIETMQDLDREMGFPHAKFKSIHVAGTNGKGSTCHMIAAALSELPKNSDCIDGEKLKVGLYTSPHLLDFRERIKVSSNNGFQMVSKEFVYSFINDYKQLFLDKQASFFEITTAMAFVWFAKQQVDVAVIECGLGGRLDSTNIVTPVLSIITNIGLDHCEHLGYTPEAIAGEKAGIIKEGIPVVIGEKSGVEDVFISKAQKCHAPIIFAEKYKSVTFGQMNANQLDLGGACQKKNILTVITALDKLLDKKIVNEQVKSSVMKGIEAAAWITGLHGRWEELCRIPFVVCDTGHNFHGFKLLGNQIVSAMQTVSHHIRHPYERLILVFGVVADKDLDAMASCLPNHCMNAAGEPVRARYYFVNAKGTRALPVQKLKEKMTAAGFDGEIIDGGTVVDTLRYYMNEVQRDTDFVFIGGSTFVVAEALAFFKEEK